MVGVRVRNRGRRPGRGHGAGHRRVVDRTSRRSSPWPGGTLVVLSVTKNSMLPGLPLKLGAGANTRFSASVGVSTVPAGDRRSVGLVEHAAGRHLGDRELIRKPSESRPVSRTGNNALRRRSASRGMLRAFRDWRRCACPGSAAVEEHRLLEARSLVPSVIRSTRRPGSSPPPGRRRPVRSRFVLRHRSRPPSGFSWTMPSCEVRMTSPLTTSRRSGAGASCHRVPDHRLSPQAGDFSGNGLNHRRHCLTPVLNGRRDDALNKLFQHGAGAAWLLHCYTSFS